MVMGYPCMSGMFSDASASTVAVAIAKVSQFGFVGDVGQWNLSMCLFNFRYTGIRFTVTWQTKNVNPTNVSRTETSLADVAALTAPVDSVDGA